MKNEMRRVRVNVKRTNLTSYTEAHLRMFEDICNDQSEGTIIAAFRRV